MFYEVILIDHESLYFRENTRKCHYCAAEISRVDRLRSVRGNPASFNSFDHRPEHFPSLQLLLNSLTLDVDSAVHA